MIFNLIWTLTVVSCATDDNFDQCKIIWSKWHNTDPIATGSEFCFYFFTQNPELLKEFPQFKDIDLAHLKENYEFRLHSSHIYVALDTAIMLQNWLDVDRMSSLHKQLGKTNKEHFNAFRKSFMEWMNLSAEQKPHMDYCMDKFFQHMFSKF